MLDRDKIIKFARHESVLLVALAVLMVLMLLYPAQIENYPRFIDWKTIFSLTGLLVLTVGMKESGVYGKVSRRLIRSLRTERQLALFSVSLAALLSTFLTNDITLFIVVPITCCTLNNMKNDLSKLIVFEALAVNVGSALTPIGNPQNLFLWHSTGSSFLTFTYRMLPLFLITFSLLIAFTIIEFPTRQIEHYTEEKSMQPTDYKLFYLSLGMLAGFIYLIDKGMESLGLVIVLLVFIFYNRRVLAKTDWFLLLFFMLVFIDLRVISRVPQIENLVSRLDLSQGKDVFLFSAFVSQIISNVPASIFVHHYTQNYLALAYGVNIGGNGLIIGSLANFIALRLVRGNKLFFKFHKYSIPFFVVSCALMYFVLK